MDAKIDSVIQEWVHKYDGDVNKAYHALRDELEQYGEVEGAAALVEERETDMWAAMRMEEMLGIEE